LTLRLRTGEARGQWHIVGNENIYRKKRHGWCETGAGWRGRDFDARRAGKPECDDADLLGALALVEESEHATYEAQFRREIELQAKIRNSADAIEGRNAFVEKRKA
jgi:hypothetical protein